MKAHYRMVCIVIIVFLLMTGNVLGARRDGFSLLQLSNADDKIDNNNASYKDMNMRDCFRALFMDTLMRCNLTIIYAYQTVSDRDRFY